VLVQPLIYSISTTAFTSVSSNLLNIFSWKSVLGCKKKGEVFYSAKIQVDFGFLVQRAGHIPTNTGEFPCWSASVPPSISGKTIILNLLE
jgi:hypothetical protein